jgi:hypothetical protein
MLKPPDCVGARLVSAGRRMIAGFGMPGNGANVTFVATADNME